MGVKNKKFNKEDFYEAKIQKTTGLLMALIMLLGVIGAAPFSAITETYLTYDEQGYFSFNPSTGELRLTSGRFNGDSFKNNDVWDVDKSEIKSVYARKNVKFEADCTSMFKDFVNCTSIDLSNVNTNEVIDMEQMFYNCRSLTSVNLSGLKTPTLGTMKKMFYNCSSLSSIDLSSFDTSKVVDMSQLFCNCSGLTSINVSGFNTGNLIFMTSMFSGCKGLTSLNLSSFDTSKVIDMNSMFYYCSSLTSLDVSKFNTGRVKSMESMFKGCKGLTSLDVSGFDTKYVNTMGSMFDGCSGLTSIDISNFDTSDVIFASYMFEGCSSLTSMDLSNFNKSCSKNYMFRNCTNLTSVNLSGSKLTKAREIFRYCTKLKELTISESVTTEMCLNQGENGNGWRVMGDATNKKVSGNDFWASIDNPNKETTYVWIGYNVVEWRNWDGKKLDSIVCSNTSSIRPKYTKDTPTRLYWIFKGWTDGKVSYGINARFPIVTQDVLYTAVFEETLGG